MIYSIISPPFALNFRDMSPEQLSEYREWFLRSIPLRTTILYDAVKESGYATWCPDFTKDSVDGLGSWMAHQVEVRQRTADEIDSIKSKTEFHFDVSDKELSSRTFSLSMDVGMYLGETLLRNFPNIEWSQIISDRKFVDFGQMVLIGFGKVPFNPVRITITFCYGIAGGQQTGKRLGEIYDYWARLAGSAATVRK